ncbi:MAG: TMEM175 family protein [Gemmatimonadales bacterium]
MTKGRLEAFSDGVIAIVITIMVLELKVPASDGWAGLAEVSRGLVAYVLSFVYLGIYWNNHHHMLHTADRVTGSILWANLHLLFWLSLVPFATAWISEHEHLGAAPTAVYGTLLLMAAIAYTILQGRIIADQGNGSRLARAVGGDWKGKFSLAAYALSIGLAFVNPWFSVVLFVVVALVWLVPDRRIEAVLGD